MVFALQKVACAAGWSNAMQKTVPRADKRGLNPVDLFPTNRVFASGFLSLLLPLLLSMAERNSSSYDLLTTLDGQHDDTIACMQFSPCGEYLVTGGDDLRMNVFDCTNKFTNILSIRSTSPPSAVCWDPTKPKSCFVGYSSGAVVSHTFGNDSEEWAAEILLFNGRCRVVALAWDKVLAVATERSVCLIKDIKASELT
jgi:WD40 repeat protein